MESEDKAAKKLYKAEQEKDELDRIKKTNKDKQQKAEKDKKAKEEQEVKDKPLKVKAQEKALIDGNGRV